MYLQTIEENKKYSSNTIQQQQQITITKQIKSNLQSQKLEPTIIIDNCSQIQINLSEKLCQKYKNKTISISSIRNNGQYQKYGQCLSCVAWEKWAFQFEFSILEIEKKLIEKQKMLQSILKKYHGQLPLPVQSFKGNQYQDITSQIGKKLIGQNQKQSKNTNKPFIQQNVNLLNNKQLITSNKVPNSNINIQTQQQNKNLIKQQNQCNKYVTNQIDKSPQKTTKKDETKNIQTINTPISKISNNYKTYNSGELKKKQKYNFTHKKMSDNLHYSYINQQTPKQAKQNYIKSILLPNDKLSKPMKFTKQTQQAQQELQNIQEIKTISKNQIKQEINCFENSDIIIKSKESIRLGIAKSKNNIKSVENQTQRNNCDEHSQENCQIFEKLNNKQTITKQQQIGQMSEELNNKELSTNKQQNAQNSDVRFMKKPQQKWNTLNIPQNKSSQLPQTLIKSSQCILNSNKQETFPQNPKQIFEQKNQQMEKSFEDKKAKHIKCFSTYCNQISETQSKKQNLYTKNLLNSHSFHHSDESPEQIEKFKNNTIKYENDKVQQTKNLSHHHNTKEIQYKNLDCSNKEHGIQKKITTKQRRQEINKQKLRQPYEQSRNIQIYYGDNINEKQNKGSNKNIYQIKRGSPLFFTKFPTQQISPHAKRGEKKKTYKYTEQYYKQRDQIKTKILSKQQLTTQQQNLLQQNQPQPEQSNQNHQNQSSNQQSPINTQTQQTKYIQINDQSYQQEQPTVKYSQLTKINSSGLSQIQSKQEKKPNNSIVFQYYDEKIKDIPSNNYHLTKMLSNKNIKKQLQFQQKIKQNIQNYSKKQNNHIKKRQIITSNVVTDPNQKRNQTQLKDTKQKRQQTPLKQEIYSNVEKQKQKPLIRKLNIGQKNEVKENTQSNENNLQQKQFKPRKILNQQYLSTINLNSNLLAHKSIDNSVNLEQNCFGTGRKKVQKSTQQQICCDKYPQIKGEKTSRQTNSQIGRQYVSTSNLNKVNNSHNIMTQIQKLKFQNQNLKSYNVVLLEKLTHCKPNKY